MTSNYRDAFHFYFKVSLPQDDYFDFFIQKIIDSTSSYRTISSYLNIRSSSNHSDMPTRVSINNGSFRIMGSGQTCMNGSVNLIVSHRGCKIKNEGTFLAMSADTFDEQISSMITKMVIWFKGYEMKVMTPEDEQYLINNMDSKEAMFILSALCKKRYSDYDITIFEKLIKFIDPHLISYVECKRLITLIIQEKNHFLTTYITEHVHYHKEAENIFRNYESLIDFDNIFYIFTNTNRTEIILKDMYIKLIGICIDRKDYLKLEILLSKYQFPDDRIIKLLEFNLDLATYLLTYLNIDNIYVNEQNLMVYSALNHSVPAESFAHIAKYGDISQEKYRDELLIILLAKGNHFDKIFASMDYISEIDVRNKYGLSCFYYACLHRNIVAMELLADKCNKNIPRNHLHSEVISWLDERIEVDLILHDLIN